MRNLKNRKFRTQWHIERTKTEMENFIEILKPIFVSIINTDKNNSNNKQLKKV